MGGCARRTQGKIYEQHVSRVSGVRHSDLFNAVSQISLILSKWVRS